jgi:rod shape-determining protein MreC
MAPPSPRRPGFSRRAQYGIFVGYVVAVVGAMLGLLLALTARFDPDGHAALQALLSDIASPISAAGRAAISAGREGSSSVSAYFDAASKNKAMEAQLKAARLKLIKGEVDALENRRLKHLLGISEELGHPIATARLISSTGSSSRRYATLAAGSSNNIANGQPVRAVEGLVGRIVVVGRVSSRVLLIVDGGNIVPVKRVTDNMPAFAIGVGDGRLEMRPLAAGTNPFKVGDIFVTSGSGGIYPPGIPVGVGVKHTREGTFARPMADPGRLDFAIVEPVFVAPPPPAVGEIPASGAN